MNDDKLVAKLRAGHALRVIASDDDRRLIRVCDIAANRIDELRAANDLHPAARRKLRGRC